MEHSKEVLDWARQKWAEADALEKKNWESAFPELKESEGERIRKEILALVKKHAVNHERCQMEAYLGKQKTIQSKNEKEYVRILKSIIADFIRDKKPEDVSFYQQIYDWLDGRHIEQKNTNSEKPNECGEEDEDERIRKALIKQFSAISMETWAGIPKIDIISWLERHKKPFIIHDTGCSKMGTKMPEYCLKPAECIEDSVKFKEGFKAGRESGLRDGQKYVLDNLDSYGLCKPAEWSEEHIADVFEKVGLAKIVREQGNDKLTNAVQSAMIELSKTGHAEWSEDFEENIRNLLHDKLTWHSEDGSMSSAVFIDDKTLKDIVNGIWFYVGKEALKYPNKELSQSEWSEEDIDKMVNARARKSGTTKSEMEFYRQGIKDTLKSRLRPQPHWKPSEEQMESLMRTITWLVEKGNLTDSSTLADLRRNLQKLM